MKLSIKDFNLPQDLERYHQAVKEFAATELEAIAEEIEATTSIPERLLPTLREAGLLTLRLPKEYGGTALTFSQYWPLLVEVAKTSGSIRMFVHGGNGLWVMIHNHGTAEQKKKYLSKVMREDGRFPCFALTEPDTGTGVDIKTTARRDGNVYKLNGKKKLITFADRASVFHVIAYTGDRSLGAKGTSMILVDPGAPGLTLESHKPLMSVRGCYHAIMHFNECEVPAGNLLGKEGEGLDIALRTFLDISRLSIAVSCVGPGERLLELASNYAKQRVTFGRPIADRQAVQQMLAEMATDLYAAKCMIADCARRYDEGEMIAAQSSMCKFFAIEMTRKVSDLALNIYGGLGLSQEFPVERLYRDVRALWFEEGSPTIQKLVIGRDVLGRPVRAIER